MKLKIILPIIVSLLLCLTVLFLFLLLRDEEECTLHTDVDENFICDSCGAELDAPEPEPCVECTDEDGNLRCDVCGEIIANTITLISDGRTEYRFVIGSGINGEAMMAIDNLAADLKKLGAEVETVYDNKSEPGEYEILFGTVTKRDNVYKLDPHDYGMKGYTVRIVGNNIIVLGGSVNSLTEAVGALRTEFFGLTGNVKALEDRVITPEESISVIQDDYKVNKLTLFGEDIRTYTIAIDKKNYDCNTAATAIQALLYEKCGYWLPIVDKAEAEKSIVLNLVSKTEGEGLYAHFSEGQIAFDVEYVTSLKKEIYNYFDTEIKNASGTLEFNSDDNFVKNVRYVYYKDFGAVGDGVTNDAEAIINAHKYANEGGHKKVIAESGKTYYIGKMSTYAAINCDVDWTGAKFIIDDSILTTKDSELGRSIFYIGGSGVITTLTPKKCTAIAEINAGGGIEAQSCGKLDLGLGYPAMLKVYNDGHKNYIRYGANSNTGAVQIEILLIDAEGNIDPTTPFMHGFEKITRIDVYKIDAPELTVKGGEFTTVASSLSSKYCSRGISVSRSNVTIDNVRHYVTGEPEKGSTYTAFLSAVNSYNLLIQNCVFSAHKTYYNSKGVGQGTYDLSFSQSINVTLKNCIQSNFFTENGALDTSRWGIMGSNYCKNITYDSCTLSRFDAHCGVWNATIKNCVIRDISVVGGGKLEIENTHIHNRIVVTLRDDYGSSWHGDVLIKDVTVAASAGYSVILFNGRWYNHDFGYATAMPTNVTVDGLKTDGGSTNVVLMNSTYRNALNKSVSDEIVSGDQSSPNVNKTSPVATITVKNNTAGLMYSFPEKELFFKDTVITVE